MFIFLGRKKTGSTLATTETQTIKRDFRGKKSINSICHKAWQTLPFDYTTENIYLTHA